MKIIDESVISNQQQQIQIQINKQLTFEQKIKNILNLQIIHIIYWILIILLIWNILQLKQESNIIRKQINNIKIQQINHQISIRTIKNDYTQQINNGEKRQILLHKNLKSSSIKASYIKQMIMEEHYLKKIQKMKNLAKTQKYLIETQNARVSYLLGMNNFKLIHQNIHIKKQIDSLLKKEYDRLSQQHDFTLPEKPFCIVVPTLNNGKDFRYQYNLRSIFNQNYTNYKVVIIDDASSDQNYELIKQYLNQNPVSQQVFLIKNQVRMTAIPNIYLAATQYCKPTDILALVDGDDELLGVNVFKVFNSMYTLKGLQVLYSNIIVNDKFENIKKGWSSAYTQLQKKYNKYREGDTRMFPLRSFNVSTFLKIRVSELKDNKGQWFRSAYDQTICPQVLELSCGKNQYIDEVFYLYNFGLGNNDIQIDRNLNYAIMNEIRHKRKKYECPTD